MEGRRGGGEVAGDRQSGRRVQRRRRRQHVAAAWWPLVNARSTKPDCLHTPPSSLSAPVPLSSCLADWLRSSTQLDADLKHLTTKVKREIDAGFAVHRQLRARSLRVLKINAHSSAPGAERGAERGGRGEVEGEQQLEEPEPEGNQWCCKNVLQVKTKSKNGLRLQVLGEGGS